VSEDTLSRIGGWCEAADDLEMDGTSITVAGDPPVEVGIETEDDAVVLTHAHAAEEAAVGFAEKAAELLGGRGSMLTGRVVTVDDGTTVDIRYPIYLDGLNRQTFLLAIRDITGTADTLTKLAPAAAEPVAETPVGEPAAEPAAAATVATAAEPEPDPEPVTAETVVVDEAARWSATHTVPGGGMSAWAEPDPGLAPIAKLVARVELQVSEQRGAWARVTGSNGWTGWVDARKLRPLTAGAATASTAAGPAAAVATGAAAGGGLAGFRPIAALGGLAMILSAFIPWNATGVSLDGTYAIPFGKAMDWPLAFIWNSLSPSQPRIGMAAIVLGLAILTLAVMPRFPQAVTIAVGAVGILIAFLFLLQFSRAPGWGDTLKIIQAGFWVFLVGAVISALPVKFKL